MVSGSDDFTLFLWNPSQEKKPLARMTGHQVSIQFLSSLYAFGLVHVVEIFVLSS